MENKIYTKGAIIRKHKLAENGKWTNYQPALDFEESGLLKYAELKKYVISANDAPRGGKWGEHYLVLKDFSANALEAEMLAESQKRDEALAEIVKADVIDTFITYSKVGSFKIDGAYYSNFCQDETNSAVVCEVDFGEFQRAEKITRRQVFNPNEPLTIVKFPEPREIEVALSDADASFGVKKIARVCGFAVWAHKLKIFVAK